MAVQNPTSITVTENAAKGWRWTFKDSTGIAINMIGFTFQGVYMSARGKPALGTFTIDSGESDLPNGIVVMSVADNWATDNLVSINKPERIMEFQLRATDPVSAYIDLYGYMTVLRSTL